MARITVEDCIEMIPNRFELVVLASQRARAILSGSTKLVDCKDKESVVALREIASNKIDPVALYGLIVNKYRKSASVTEESVKDVKSFFAASNMENMRFSEDSTEGVANNVSIDSDIFASQNLDVCD